MGSRRIWAGGLVQPLYGLYDLEVLMINSKILLIIFFFVSFMLPKCYLSSKSVSLLKEIDSTQKKFYQEKYNSNEPLSYSLLRHKIFNSKKMINFLNTTDTIIIFHSHDIQTANDNGSIWSRNESYNFESYSGSFKLIKEECSYSDFIINKIKLKDFESIKNTEEKEGALLGGSIVNVILIIKKNNRNEITSFVFNEFFSSLRPIE